MCYLSDDSNDNNAITNSTSLRKNRLNSIRVIHKKATTATLQNGSKISAFDPVGSFAKNSSFPDV